MAFLERDVAKLREDQWEHFVENARKWDAVAKKHGFPPAMRYRYSFGMQPWGTTVTEYLWESLTEMEAKWASFWADPDGQPLGDQLSKIVESLHRELLFTMEEFE